MKDLKEAVSREFTEDDIKKLKKDLHGVYGIFNSKEWIYVGRGNIRDRMLKWVNGDNPRITKAKPTGWCAIVTDDDKDIEKAMIRKYDPVANRREG